MTPCDLVAPWYWEGLCCAWWLWCVGLATGCGGKVCCLFLVAFSWIRGERLHALLAFGQGLLVVCRAPAPAQDAVKGRHAGGGGGELAGVVVGDEVDMFEEQLVEHASDVVGCVVVGVSHMLGDV